MDPHGIFAHLSSRTNAAAGPPKKNLDPLRSIFGTASSATNAVTGPPDPGRLSCMRNIFTPASSPPTAATRRPYPGAMSSRNIFAHVTDELIMGDAVDVEPKTQRLMDLAASPSILELPGLAFLPDEDDRVLALHQAKSLGLIVDNPNSTDPDDRLLAGLRLGVWFQHGLKVVMENRGMKRDSQMYSLIQESVRSEHPDVAARNLCAGKRIKAMFDMLVKARIRYLKEKLAAAQEFDTDMAEPESETETAFLEPLDLWVNLYTGVKNSGRHAKAFIEAADWLPKNMNAYKKKTGTDATIAPAAPPAALEDSARGPGTRKRPRTDDDADPAIKPAQDAVIDNILAILLPPEKLRQEIQDRLNRYGQEIKRKAEQLAEAEITKLSNENDQLRIEILTLRGEKAHAVAKLQREMSEIIAENADAVAKLQRQMSEVFGENGDIQAQLANLESDMQMLHMDAEIAGDVGLQAAEAMIKARDEEIQVAVAKAQAAEEQKQVAKKELEEVRASRDELIKAHDAATEEMKAELAAKDNELEKALRQEVEDLDTKKE